MTKFRSPPVAAALALAAGLGGCVSLLPKTPPSQLYRFAYRPGSAPEQAGAACDSRRAVGVIVTPPDFPRASGTDQILTASGDETAYIAASRWVSPAHNLFEDAVEDAFRRSCAVRLVRRVDAGAGSVRLRTDIDRFEADYPAGTVRTAKTAASAPAPTVAVGFKATLLKRGGDFGAEKRFSVSRPAADNRVGAIVAAYSAAVSQALDDLVAWTDSQGPEISARQDGPQPVLDRLAPPRRERSTSSSSTTTTTTTTLPAGAPR